MEGRLSKMDLRSIVRQIQKGNATFSDDNLFPPNSILRCNTASDLVNFIKASNCEKGRFDFYECAKKTYGYSHLDDVGKYEQLLRNVKSGAPVIVISHQPTMFPYSGVYIQFFLAEYILKRLKDINGVEAIVVYLCLDSDDAFDRRIKTAHFPCPVSRNGSIPISYELSKKYRNCPQFAVPFANTGYKIKWKNSILGALNLLASEIPDYVQDIKTAKENLSFYFDNILEETFSLLPENFSDFSLSILMRFLREVLDIPVIPLRFSDLFSTGKRAVIPILERWEEISDLGTEFLGRCNLQNKGLFSIKPMWAVCKRCKNRNSLSFTYALDALSSTKLNFECSRCDSALCEIDKDFSLMPKVIIEDLMGPIFTSATLVLTYAGSTEHLVFSNAINENVLSGKASIFTWHPKQYLGTIFDKASICLYQRGVKKNASKLSLLKNLEGRDPLLCLFVDDVANKIKTEWMQHFSSNSLNMRMVYSERSMS